MLAFSLGERPAFDTKGRPLEAMERVMTSATRFPKRRQFLVGAAAITGLAALGGHPFAGPARAEAARGALEPTETMRGGSNNYIPNAPLVDNLGKGLVVSGTVRRADTGAAASGVRIQIWAATERGGEREPSNRGSVLTGADGRYRLEIGPIVPNFGQPHIHMAYDDGAYETLFLRPVLDSRDQPTLEINIVLAPASPAASES